MRSTSRSLTAALLSLTLLSLAPAAAQARGRHGPPSPEQAVERLSQQLELSVEQREQVQTILTDAFSQRRTLRVQHRDERDTLRDDTDEKLAAVLTGEQMEELLQLRDERRERRPDWGRCEEREGRGRPDSE